MKDIGFCRALLQGERLDLRILLRDRDRRREEMSVADPRVVCVVWSNGSSVATKRQSLV